ncbi:MAG TPA: PAS domain S-box protein [Thermoplasmata archaeon]|nr:PAS domain S-box protein [Thermoplasmata archaeon]
MEGDDPDGKEGLYATVLTSILDASTMYSIVATRLDGTFVLWNEGARRTYGYDAPEVIGQNLRILHRPEDLRSGKVDSVFAEAFQHGLWEGVIDRVRKGGETFPARMVMTLRRDRTGAPVGFLSISKDISEEIQTAQRLQASEAYSRGLVESSIDGILTTDLDGQILDVNREVENLTGLPRTQLIGMGLAELVEPPAGADAAVHRVAQLGSVKDLEFRLRQRDGSLTDVSFNAALRREDDGASVGVIATIRDAGATKRSREALQMRNRELEIQNERVQEASRMKSEFLANMSHELRTPLNSIIGFSDFLLTSGDDRLSPEQREYLTDILNSGNHLLSLINDVLDLAKIESGKLEIHPAPFALPHAVDEVCSSLRPQLQSFELEMQTDIDREIDWVILDGVRFKQILYNLLSNAVKFTPKGGRIRITVTPTGWSRFRMSVQDTGIGIPAKDLARIFREFEQLDSGPDRLYAGTGLGLPVTQKIVNLMGGSINVQSEPGKGSTFTVHLPLVRASAPAASVAQQGVPV